MSAPTVGCASVGRITQNATNGGHIPAHFSSWRQNPVVAESLGNPVERYSGAGVCVPGKDLFDDFVLDRLHLHTAGIVRSLHIKQVAIGCRSPRQQRSTAQFGLSPTSGSPLGPFRNQAAFVFSNCPPYLQEKLVM